VVEHVAPSPVHVACGSLDRLAFLVLQPAICGALVPPRHDLADRPGHRMQGSPVIPEHHPALPMFPLSSRHLLGRLSGFPPVHVDIRLRLRYLPTAVVGKLMDNCARMLPRYGPEPPMGLCCKPDHSGCTGSTGHVSRCRHGREVGNCSHRMKYRGRGFDEP
jgi:hypothetical protein